jgi:hypothetical protein
METSCAFDEQHLLQSAGRQIPTLWLIWRKWRKRSCLLAIFVSSFGDSREVGSPYRTRWFVLLFQFGHTKSGRLIMRRMKHNKECMKRE